MRGLAILPLLFGLACTNEDPVPAFIAVEYQLRCMGSCMESPDAPRRLISNVDSEDQLKLTCDVKQEGDEQLLSFRASCGGSGDDDDMGSCGKDRFRLEVRDVALDGSGKVKDPGERCEVIIFENSTTYRGRCTGDEPDEEEGPRCQVKLEVEGSAVEGTVYCVEVAPKEAPTNTRYLVAPFSRDPVSFTLEGCLGL